MSADADLIASLRLDKKRLSDVVTTQTRTIYDLRGRVRDSVVYTYSDSSVVVFDTIRCIDYSDEWVTMTGCIDDSAFGFELVTRDSLVVALSSKRKRLWGFLWHVGEPVYNGTVLSKNPHTEIEGVEFVKMR
jgi:hypothetical protein